MAPFRAVCHSRPDLCLPLKTERCGQIVFCFFLAAFYNHVRAQATLHVGARDHTMSITCTIVCIFVLEFFCDFAIVAHNLVSKFCSWLTLLTSAERQADIGR